MKKAMNDYRVAVAGVVNGQKDVLSWWKSNAATHPLVAEAARATLVMAIASSGVERLISIAGFLKNILRNRMSAKALDDLISLRTKRATALA